MMNVLDENTILNKIDMAEKFKYKGNEFYKNGDYKNALRNYHRGLMHVKGLKDPETSLYSFLAATSNRSDQEMTDSNIMYVKLQNNIAACILKMTPVRYERVKKCCLEITKMQPENAKAWYRLSLSYYHLDDIKKAEEALTKADTLSKNKDAAINNLSLLITTKLKQDEKEAVKIFRNNPLFQDSFRSTGSS